MGPALLVCRLILAGVLIVAGVAKLADAAGSRQAVEGFGVPEPLTGPVTALLPIAELLTGIALVPLFSARFGAIAAAVLLICFCIGIANALAHGRAPDCHCFGQVHSEPAGWRTLARNAVLLAIAVFVAIGGWHSSGVSATRWVTDVGGAWLVVIGAGIVILALVSFQIWFSLQLLSQNGRALGRIEALESLLEGVIQQLGLDPSIALAHEPLGAGLPSGGLPVGADAPRFELDGIDGGRYSLGSLLELERVLLQPERQVAEAYQSHGTPMAVVIGRDGTIASPSVGGSEAISTAIASRSVMPIASAHWRCSGIPAAVSASGSSRTSRRSSANRLRMPRCCS